MQKGGDVALKKCEKVLTTDELNSVDLICAMNFKFQKIL